MVPFTNLLECEADLVLPFHNTDTPESDNDSAGQDNAPVDAESATLLIGAVNEQAELLMKAIREAHKAGVPIRVEADYRSFRVGYQM